MVTRPAIKARGIALPWQGWRTALGKPVRAPAATPAPSRLAARRPTLAPPLVNLLVHYPRSSPTRHDPARGALPPRTHELPHPLRLLHRPHERPQGRPPTGT